MMWNNLKNMTWLPKNGHVDKHQGIAVKFAFREGVDYYTFVQPLDIPELRMRFAQRFLEEMQIKCNKEYLNDVADAILGCVDIKEGEIIKLSKISRIAMELKKRLDWIFEPDTLYRFATVMYFDLNEDIREYDISYQRKKLERFKKKGLKYFLSELTENSEKLVNMSEEDFKTYTNQLKEQIDEQSKLIQSQKDK